ncbi:MAG: hypothetical protein F6K35_29245 [Okeania sp. SIO2H7]|nr:hypothetical protein [Okeania sp. SIO2H7]
MQFLKKTSKVLRSHLNGIICSIQLVLDDLCDNREEEIEYLEQCRDCALKLFAVLEECFNLLQSEQLKTLQETHIPRQQRTDVLSITCEALRTHLNGSIGSLQLILNDCCDNREEEIKCLQQSFDCSLKFLGVLEEFFNVLQEEKEVGASQF